MSRFWIALALTLAAAACGEVGQLPLGGAAATQTDPGLQDDAESTVSDAGVVEEMSDDAGTELEERVPTIFERGPFNVGHRRIEFSYDAISQPGRKIKLVVWYPTRDTEGDPGTYLVTLKRPEVLADAVPAIDEPAPLLVFSHGNSAIAEQSYFMTELWATHGWVVIAPYHTGNTILDSRDGINFRSAAVRPQDITASLDVIYGLGDDDPLANKISDDVVLSGHSFGGFTTLAVSGAGFEVEEMIELCATPAAPAACDMLEIEGVEDMFRAGFLDERVDVAIPQAPGGYFAFGEGLSRIEIPTLVFTGALDKTLRPQEEGEPIWRTMQGPHMRVDFTGGGHFTFSNMCELFGSIPQIREDGCGTENTEPWLAFEMINAYSLAFARFHLFGDETNRDLLEGVDDRYAGAATLDWKPGTALAP